MTDESEHEKLDAEAAVKKRFREASVGVTRRIGGSLTATPTDLAAGVSEELATLDEPDLWDRYGDSGAVEILEKQVAELLGKSAAVMFPSGIMAQQSVLRAWTDRQQTKRVAIPDLSHLLRYELDGPARLHGFEYEHLTTGPVAPTKAALDAIPGRLGAALVELPLRDAGYLLPSWDELAELSAACRERGVPLHFDGARIWESQPYLAHTLAEIAGLADSVYVSLYKGLGGLAGAVVVGDEDFIAEVRQWRTRHGGTLVTMMPLAVSGLRGLRLRLPQMGDHYARAVELAAALAERGFRMFPDPPHTNAFRVYAERPHLEIVERVVAAMETDQLAVSPPWNPADVPGWSWTEFVVGEATMDWSVDDAVDQFTSTILA